MVLFNRLLYSICNESEECHERAKRFRELVKARKIYSNR